MGPKDDRGIVGPLVLIVLALLIPVAVKLVLSVLQ